MNQTDKGNSITKGELEAIRDKYRQQRYDECIKAVKSKLKQSPNSLHLLNYQAMASRYLVLIILFLHCDCPSCRC